PAFDRSVDHRLRAVIKKYDRGSAVYDPAKDTPDRMRLDKAAFSLGWWLDNWEREVDPQMLAEKRRGEELHERRMAYYDGRMHWSLARLALYVLAYLAALVHMVWRSRRLRAMEQKLRRPG